MLQLEVMRKEIFREIEKENDEGVLEKIILYINELRMPHMTIHPCCYTDEVKKVRIEQSVRDAVAGLGISQERMIERHSEWL